MTDATPSAATADTPVGGHGAPAGKAKGPFGKLYNWVLKLARSKHAEPSLFGVSFAESSFFPIPPDVMLAPMCFARPDRAYRYALICTIASVLGALLGYAIGLLLYESVGKAIIGFFGYGGREEQLRRDYAGEAGQFLSPAFWVILAKGLTPIPFKLITIISGAFQMSLLAFVTACVITRGARFFIVAFLCKTFGPALAPVIEKRIGIVMILVLVVIVGGIVALRFIPH
jgi:membrane protein YqaA with SNARE-associated domain